MSQGKTTPNGQPAIENPAYIDVPFGPTVDARLDDAASPSQTIRDAIHAGLDRYAPLFVFARDAPARVIPWGHLGAARSVRCPEAVVDDLDTLVEKGLGQNRAHAVRILVREHLEVSVDVED